MPKKTHPLADAASAYTGYTSRASDNVFAINAGYVGGFQWDGSFIDQVFQDAGTASALPRHSNTTAALGFYLKNGWQRRAPKAGDLVFYNFTTDSKTVSFDQPHIGIVTDTSTWKEHRTFKAVEGQVSSGQPKASTDENGVYERTRYATDVLSFIRIPTNYLKPTVRPALKDDSHVVRPAHLERCMGSKQAASAKPNIRKSTELVQIALAAHPGIQLQNADRGNFNGKTIQALAAFQRLNGFPASECTGAPTVRTLELLAPYGDFKVDS